MEFHHSASHIAPRGKEAQATHVSCLPLLSHFTCFPWGLLLTAFHSLCSLSLPLVSYHPSARICGVGTYQQNTNEKSTPKRKTLKKHIHAAAVRYGVHCGRDSGLKVHLKGTISTKPAKRWATTEVAIYFIFRAVRPPQG